jgi:hypothetical protein
MSLGLFWMVLRPEGQEDSTPGFQPRVSTLANAAEACLFEQPDAIAHLLCAGVFREIFAMVKQMDEGELTS